MNTILYVEDDPQNVAVAQLRLGRRYELLTASDDATACAILKERGADLTAVLMDIELKGSLLGGALAEAIQEKGSLLARNYATSLRPLVVDNAFSDVERLLTYEVERDRDVLYGAYVHSNGRAWALARKPGLDDNSDRRRRAAG